jgi:hypothetical protein
MKWFTKLGVWASLASIISLAIIPFTCSTSNSVVQKTVGSQSPAVSSKGDVTIQNDSHNLTIGHMDGGMLITDPKYIYAPVFMSPNAPTAHVLAMTVQERMQEMKQELSMRYPYGFTLVGLKGTMFTTVDYENSYFQFDRSKTTIKVDTAKKTITLSTTIIQLRDLPPADHLKIDGARISSTFSSTNTNEQLLSLFSTGGIATYASIIDIDSTNPILAVGLRSAPPGMRSTSQMLHEVLVDAQMRAVTNKDVERRLEGIGLTSNSPVVP